MSRHFAVGLLAAAAVLAAAPAAARADDAGVRKAVITQEKRVAPDNKAFQKAFKNLTRSKVPKAKAATDKLISDVAAYRSALKAKTGTTANVKKGRLLLLAALSTQRSGLRALKTALAKYTSGESESSVKQSVDTAVKKLTAGQKQAVKGVKLIGITGTET